MGEDARQARIAQLRAEAAREKAEEQRKVMEQRMKQQLESGVLRAVEQVEGTLEAQIKRLEEVENMGDEELELLRERRLRQAREQAKKTEKWKLLGHGEYRTCADEKDFFAQAKASERLVVHFGRNATRRCEIVDGHLSKLAKKHIETKFVRVEAERSPFLAERLRIHTLPSIVLVKNGKTDHTLVGFEEFGGVDDFSTVTMEKVLAKYELISSSITVDEEPESSNSSSTRFGRTAQAIRKGNVSMDDWED